MYMDCEVTYWEMRINGQSKHFQMQHWKLICIILRFLMSSKIHTPDYDTLHNT